jgi:hypothetical protein
MTTEAAPAQTPRKLGEGRYRIEAGQPAYLTRIFKDDVEMTNVLGFRCEARDGMTVLVLTIHPEMVEIVTAEAEEVTELHRITALMDGLSLTASATVVDALVEQQRRREMFHSLPLRLKRRLDERP